eukprot:COSAG03_NODE_9663_length_702_cov_0.890547_1_plen_128_part_00
MVIPLGVIYDSTNKEDVKEALTDVVDGATNATVVANVVASLVNAVAEEAEEPAIEVDGATEDDEATVRRVARRSPAIQALAHPVRRREGGQRLHGGGRGCAATESRDDRRLKSSSRSTRKSLTCLPR